MLDRGAAGFRVVRIGGPKVPKVRGNIVDPVDWRDVNMYRDSSIAPLLDLRRHLKVVGDVLGEMVLYLVPLNLLLNGIACSGASYRC